MLDELITKHFSRKNRDKLQEDFAKNDYAILEEYVPPLLMRLMEYESKYLLEKTAKRKDMIMKETGDTPRNFTTVSCTEIKKEGYLVPHLFMHEAVKELLSGITGENINAIPYEPEQIIINKLEKSGDSHGWHWDDYSFSVVYVVEEPDYTYGGQVELITGTQWDRGDSKRCLDEYLQQDRVISVRPRRNEAYILRSDTALHRVAPITSDSTSRLVVVYGYATDEDLKKEIDHSTVKNLWS